MPLDLNLTPELQSRIDALSTASGRSAADVISDALENGHSLEWQEQFLKKVARGIAAAERGDFASEADVERVKNKYRDA
ncbi:hypothetical protein ABAC460_04480 [Asticcacaulis sp. AC460]|uniref:CopG family ribbon-helix-helix protein n=1 Tax=Asticcacaulis sp. AC460 TaxID=1282360 RepID=UPI0003C3EA96|nr:hypothetical protein [Asticcacaulis sp. AC460]ESQ92149.1 hypothetical protein ABAC460_04480 [Asticcacaulis sp. AC460]